MFGSRIDSLARRGYSVELMHGATRLGYSAAPLGWDARVEYLDLIPGLDGLGYSTRDRKKTWLFRDRKKTWLKLTSI